MCARPNAARTALALAHYQLGRLVGLAGLGALVGGAVAAIPGDSGLAPGRGALLVGMGVLVLVSAHGGGGEVIVIGRARTAQGRARGAVDDAIARVARAAATLAQRPFAFGLAMSLMPCMIMLWALALAAGAGSALGGAIVMAALVTLTTVPLSVAALAARVLGAAFGRLQRVLPALSGAWLIAVGLAAAGLIEHRHVVVDVFGPRTVMLW